MILPDQFQELLREYHQLGQTKRGLDSQLRGKTWSKISVEERVELEDLEIRTATRAVLPNVLLKALTGENQLIFTGRSNAVDREVEAYCRQMGLSVQRSSELRDGRVETPLLVCRWR